MVEFHYAKKRRGIASITGKSNRAVEPKPYWPGLEIDEHDRKKSSHGRINNDINGDITSINPNIQSHSEEETRGKMDGATSSETQEESGTSGQSSATNDQKNSSTKRCAVGVPKFRSRKRKSKISINLCSGDNLPKKGPNDIRLTGEKQEVGINMTNNHAVALSSTKAGMRKIAQSIEAITKDSSKNDTASFENVSGDDKLSDRISAVTMNSNLVSSKKTNVVDDNKDDLSSTSSNEGKPSISTTPRALVTFLLRKKFPVLDDVLSSIRDILFGMVSQSPAILQKHLAKATTTSHAASATRSSDSGNFQIPLRGKSHEETISKLQDICKRQEILLDRIAGIESATRLEDCRNQTQDGDVTQRLRHRQQPKEQRQVQKEIDSTTKLHRDYQKLQETNTSLKMKLDASNKSIESHRLELQAYIETIQELEKSKRSIQYTFRSRFDEQFRELSERDLIIEKQRTLLRVARAENEKLRGRIVRLEDGRYRSSDSNHYRGSDISANENFAFLAEDIETTHSHEGHHAYSHRIRDSSSNGKQQKNLCSLQLTNVSAFGSGAPVMSGISNASSTNSAYIPRIRHTTSKS